jgi:hypothetical protein
MTAKKNRELSKTRALPAEFLEEDELYGFPKRRKPDTEYEYVENHAPLLNESFGDGEGAAMGIQNQKKPRFDSSYSYEEGCEGHGQGHGVVAAGGDSRRKACYDNGNGAWESANNNRNIDRSLSGKKRTLETETSDCDCEDKVNSSIDIERDVESETLREFSDLSVQKQKSRTRGHYNDRYSRDREKDEEMMEYNDNSHSYVNADKGEGGHGESYIGDLSLSDVKYEENNSVLRQLRIERELRRGRKEAQAARGKSANKPVFSISALAVGGASSTAEMAIETEQCGYDNQQQSTSTSTTRNRDRNKNNSKSTKEVNLNLMQFQQKHARLYEQRQREADELDSAEIAAGFYANSSKSLFGSVRMMGTTGMTGIGSRDNKEGDGGENTYTYTNTNTSTNTDHSAAMSEG